MVGVEPLNQFLEARLDVGLGGGIFKIELAQALPFGALEPGKELMSSEKIAELGITKKSLLDSLNLDPQVKAADCVEGEFIVKTIRGEIKFRLVFGDEGSGGRA